MLIAVGVQWPESGEQSVRPHAAEWAQSGYMYGYTNVYDIQGQGNLQRTGWEARRNSFVGFNLDLCARDSHLTSGVWFLHGQWRCTTFVAVLGCMLPLTSSLAIPLVPTPDTSSIFWSLAILSSVLFLELSLSLCLLTCSLSRLRHGPSVSVVPQRPHCGIVSGGKDPSFLMPGRS